MRFSELIWKNLCERPARSVFTVIGLAVAVAAIATLWDMAWGYADSSRSYYAQRAVDIVVVRAGVSNRFTSRMSTDVGRHIESVGGVERVDGVLTEQVSLGVANVIGIPLRGYAPNSPQWERMQLSSGRTIGPGDRDAVLLGRAFADALLLREGQKLEIEGKAFDVLGVFQADNPFDANCIVAKLTEVQALMDRPGVVSEFQVTVAATVRGQDAMRELCRQIEALQDGAQETFGLKAQPTNDFVTSATEAKLGNAMAWATSSIVIALSMLGMLNTMLMSVLDRKREIGLLRAVGWTRARIVRLILGESFVMSFLATVVGVSIAWAAVRFLSQWPRTSLLAPEGVSAAGVGLGLLAAVATGFAGALYPALHAARVPPVESLRHE